MALVVKHSGLIVPVKQVFVKTDGVIREVQTAYVSRLGTPRLLFRRALTVNVSADTAGLIVSSLYSSADWTSDVPKIVNIRPGVAIRGVNWGALALQGGGNPSGATWGNTLTINNYGEIQGLGGQPNGGWGMSAVYEDTVTLGKRAIFNNFGAIRSGGGAGGVGGAGVVNTTVREPPSGENYSEPTYLFVRRNDGRISISWGGAYNIINEANLGYNTTQYTSGAYTYYRGGQVRIEGNYTYFGVYRTYGSSVASSGGNGGRGQGSDGGNSAGLAGGQNAGAGGWGNSWGLNGLPGAAGNAGAGGAGGLAGIAYSSAVLDMNNQGTIQGRVV